MVATNGSGATERERPQSRENFTNCSVALAWTRSSAVGTRNG